MIDYPLACLYALYTIFVPIGLILLIISSFIIAYVIHCIQEEIEYQKAHHGKTTRKR